jgi:hypothetical protein
VGGQTVEEVLMHRGGSNLLCDLSQHAARAATGTRPRADARWRQAHQDVQG